MRKTLKRGAAFCLAAMMALTACGAKSGNSGETGGQAAETKAQTQAEEKTEVRHLTLAAVASSSGWFPYCVSIGKVLSTLPELDITVSESGGNVDNTQQLRAGVISIANSISNTDWFMVTILPAPPLIHESNHLMLQIALLYAGFLVLALIFANVLAHSITGRLSSVIRQMQTVRHGPPTPMESPQAHDEIGDLIDTYNYMTRKMYELMEKQAKAAEDLRIAEFNSLQAQINPHFLYNTMDMINWMALQGQTEEISHAVQSLSRFYKLTLSRKKGISTIARELEHVTIYVQLQNMRYHDSIELITDIPDELSEYQIPKLTLQPVVENSILHGILEKESKSGTIVITGWMENEDIVLLISDDGVGIPPEILSTILSGKGNSQSGGTNIAVYNTHRRLQILYGKDYGLIYSSNPGEGTEVEIRFPAHREE